MKKIEAIVRSHCLQDVVTRLRLVGVTGMTLSDVLGVSSSTATVGVFHGQRYLMQGASRCQITIVTPDGDAPNVVRAIAHSACTEAAGDGIITITDVVDVVRIRTGESGPEGL